MLNMMVVQLHVCCTVFVFFVKKNLACMLYSFCIFCKKKFGSGAMAGRGGQETCDKKTDWLLQDGKKGKGK